MNEILDDSLLINIRYIVEFLSYFIFAFTSSLLKEVYCANTIRNYNFGPYRVICSTIIATLGTMALKEIYSQELNGLWGVTALISTVFGLLGFEIFKHLTSIAGIKSLLKEIKKIKDGASDIIEDDDYDEEIVRIKKDKHGKSIQHIQKKKHEDD